MRKVALILGSFLFVTNAFAKSYKPLVHCEAGQVALDQIIADDGRIEGYQVVVHGLGLIDRVTRETSFRARFYDGGDHEVDVWHRFGKAETMVASVPLEGFGAKDPFPNSVTAYRNFGDLVLLQKDGGSEGGGNYQTFNYIFRGCF